MRARHCATRPGRSKLRGSGADAPTSRKQRYRILFVAGSVHQTPELHQRLLRPLNAAGVRYMVTGGLAAIVYGEPRLTNDVDIVVQLAPSDAARFLDAFVTSEYYLPPREVVEEEAGRRAFGHFNIIHLESALRADIYCVGDDPFGAWALDHRHAIEIAGEKMWLAPVEYVIVQKLRYYRESGSERHLRDIAAMRRISGDLIDLSVIEGWVTRLALEPEWAKALRADV